MTNTKWLSALLAGTALSVASTAAMADSTFLTMTRNAAGEGYTFSVAPTADMPASATEVTVSGEVRTLIKSSNPEDGDSNTDVYGRGRVFVKGVTETAVGEVGAKLRIGAGGVETYTGHWKASSDLTVFGGRTDSIASIQHGADWNGTGGVWDGSGAGLTNTTATQAGVTFTSGPVSATIGLEAKSDGGATSSVSWYGDATVNVAGSLSFSSGPLSMQVAGRMGKSTTSSSSSDYDTDSMVGIGATYSVGALSLSAAYARGEGNQQEWTYVYGSNDGRDSFADDNSWTAGSLLATYQLNETTRIEGFVGMANVDLGSYNEDEGVADEISGFGAGVFYAPVSQLTLGAGASTSKTSFDFDSNGTGTSVAAHSDTTTTVGVGAWFKF